MHPSLNDLMLRSLDITAPDVGVHVAVDNRRGVIYVNVDGLCVLRICRTKNVNLEVIPQPGLKCEWLPACNRDVRATALHPHNGVMLNICATCAMNASQLGWEILTGEEH